jgi:hypothetical protein
VAFDSSVEGERHSGLSSGAPVGRRLGNRGEGVAVSALIALSSQTIHFCLELAHPCRSGRVGVFYEVVAG